MYYMYIYMTVIFKKVKFSIFTHFDIKIKTKLYLFNFVSAFLSAILLLFGILSIISDVFNVGFHITRAIPSFRERPTHIFSHELY